jgi:hypothetical protein
MRRTSRKPWTRPLQAERRSAFVEVPVGDADDGSSANVRAVSAPRRCWSNKAVDRGKSGRGATGADDRLRTLRPNRHAAGGSRAVVGGRPSAGLRILVRPARWTGIPTARSRLKITFARGGAQSTGAPLAYSRRLRRRRAQVLKRQALLGAGYGRRLRQRTGAAAAASAVPTAIHQIHQSTFNPA